MKHPNDGNPIKENANHTTSQTGANLPKDKNQTNIQMI